VFRSATSALRSRNQDGIFSASPIASREGESSCALNPALLSNSKYVSALWYWLNPKVPPAKFILAFEA
jgi:hypothetical protein